MPRLQTGNLYDMNAQIKVIKRSRAPAPDRTILFLHAPAMETSVLQRLLKNHTQTKSIIKADLSGNGEPKESNKNPVLFGFEPIFPKYGSLFKGNTRLLKCYLMADVAIIKTPIRTLAL